MNPVRSLPRPAGPSRKGVAYALGAYAIWGGLPLYFHLLAGIDPLLIVAFRVLFSVPLCLAMAAAAGQFGAIRHALATPRHAAALLASAAMIALNWSVYIASVQQGHVLATSLGYYINPLVSVLLGTVFLRERLGWRQWLAVAVAGLAVTLLAWGAREMLWISVTLAISFGLYGLIRKVVPVPAIAGLTVETLVLAPFAGIYLASAEVHAAAPLLWANWTVTALLVGSALLTVIPLVMFAEGARRLELSTLGFIQYLTPSISFVIGLAVLGERLRPVQLACFALIWLAIAIYVADLLLQRRAATNR